MLWSMKHRRKLPVRPLAEGWIAHGQGAAAARNRYPPPLHHRGNRPVRHRRVGAARLADPELQRRRRRLLPARRRVPDDVVAERHEHRRPEVLPRHARHCPSARVAAPGHRPRRRHDHRLGNQGRLLRRRRRSRGVPRRAQVRARPPARRVQLAGVVQHRREGRPAAGECVLHPRGRRHDGRDPQLVPGRGNASSRAARARASTCRTSARRRSSSRAAAPRRAR